MAQLPSEVISHARKVCNLYKRAIRSLQDYYPRRVEFRYHAVLMRDRFDKNKVQPDARVAKQLLVQGQRELIRKQHFQPIKFANSPGGLAYERVVEAPDWVLDYWDPMEKACYPKYFARREEMKKEYVEYYNKLYPQQEAAAKK